MTLAPKPDADIFIHSEITARYRKYLLVRELMSKMNTETRFIQVLRFMSPGYDLYPWSSARSRGLYQPSLSLTHTDPGQAPTEALPFQDQHRRIILFTSSTLTDGTVCVGYNSARKIRPLVNTRTDSRRYQHLSKRPSEGDKVTR